MTSEMAGERPRALASAGLTAAVMESSKVVLPSTVAPAALNSDRSGDCAGQAAPAETLASTGQGALRTSTTL